MKTPARPTNPGFPGGYLPSFLLLLAACLPGAAAALDFRSVAAAHAVLYDAPSPQAKKRYVVGKYFPVEAVIVLDSMVKVRDSSGELSWIEKKNLSEARTVVVTAPRADIRQAPDKNAALVFQADKDVALELVEAPRTGWAKVRHRDGQSGFVAASQVWGL
ncbi:MAG: SH3 domain-containing protein [Sulfuricella sp.]|nr:SH3 domain-containing protein [Sulfuricella sp.]